jgi:hypothetical protein
VRCARQEETRREREEGALPERSIELHLKDRGGRTGAAGSASPCEEGDTAMTIEGWTAKPSVGTAPCQPPESQRAIAFRSSDSSTIGFVM